MQQISAADIATVTRPRRAQRRRARPTMPGRCHLPPGHLRYGDCCSSTGRRSRRALDARAAPRPLARCPARDPVRASPTLLPVQSPAETDAGVSPPSRAAPRAGALCMLCVCCACAGVLTLSVVVGVCVCVCVVCVRCGPRMVARASGGGRWRCACALCVRCRVCCVAPGMQHTHSTHAHSTETPAPLR